MRGRRSRRSREPWGESSALHPNTQGPPPGRCPHPLDVRGVGMSGRAQEVVVVRTAHMAVVMRMAVVMHMAVVIHMAVVMRRGPSVMGHAGFWE